LSDFVRLELSDATLQTFALVLLPLKIGFESNAAMSAEILAFPLELSFLLADGFQSSCDPMLELDSVLVEAFLAFPHAKFTIFEIRLPFFHQRRSDWLS
jgi:hypothetical protein